MIINRGEKITITFEEHDTDQLKRFINAKLDEMFILGRIVNSTPLVKKEVGKATAYLTQKNKEFKKPDDIKSCSQKQYNILKQADFDDEAIKLMSQEEISKSIGYYLNNQKKENI